MGAVTIAVSQPPLSLLDKGSQENMGSQHNSPTKWPSRACCPQRHCPVLWLLLRWVLGIKL